MLIFENTANFQLMLTNFPKNIIPKVLSSKNILIRLSISKIYNKLLNKAAPLFTPFPEDEWQEFDQEYYSKDRFGFKNLEIKEI